MINNSKKINKIFVKVMEKSSLQSGFLYVYVCECDDIDECKLCGCRTRKLKKKFEIFCF